MGNIFIIILYSILKPLLQFPLMRFDTSHEKNTEIRMYQNKTVFTASDASHALVNNNATDNLPQ